MKRVDVAIVGGGFTGAVFAIHLTRMANDPLDIALIDPNPNSGRGLAYGTSDPEHRLNAPIGFHLVYPDNLGHLAHWYETNRILERDPEARGADGQIYMRRQDFGRYVGEQLQAHVQQNPSSSRIVHLVDNVVAVDRDDSSFLLKTEGGESLKARLVVVTTSYERPAVPHVFQDDLVTHPSFFRDPWDRERVASIGGGTNVLVVGMAQTASDVMASLITRGHTGPIQAVSRRGLRPVVRPAGAPPPPDPITERVNQNPSLFVAKHGHQSSALDVLRTLRHEINDLEARGDYWTTAFNDLRDSIWQIWPALSDDAKAAFMRHLRPWFDVHRFRLPPQVETKIHAAEARGQLSFQAARLTSAVSTGDAIEITMRYRDGTTQTRTFDAVINCTGPETNPARCVNPLLRNLVQKTYASPHPLGLGFHTDATGYSFDARGNVDERLLFAGPLTYGTFGDQQGAIFIAARLAKMMPKFIGNLHRLD
jgi:uncharacterized NAD(P)/FAD-binding protein YdhS